MNTSTTASSRLAPSAERGNQAVLEPVKGEQRSALQPGQHAGSHARNPAQRALDRRSGSHARNSAQQALDKRTLKHTLPQHVRAGLSSPTDKIQSPATKAVRGLRHNKHSEHLPKPQVLGSLFKSMQKKVVE
ncbi:hypothetical protein GGH12_001961 [Coemansia sp. RSA 1822]|nr:hypothetical protein LPJ76_000582 [Coemansia sp. RSA 638]KAJ2122607.1 hypothetical protein IW147_003269 [Coemansia sp. RSA 720]KAJ2544750.1 hypothetical protein GGF49_000958 [Coemansia sp. RSA 1853]KAJ2564520.1 hypothetical protein GGH12_001961 [Coemansia sp. RSA 1822]